MSVIITDGTYFIKATSTGQYTLCSSKSVATVFTEDKATHVLGALPKILQKYDWGVERGPADPVTLKDIQIASSNYVHVDSSELFEQITCASEIIVKAVGNAKHLQKMLQAADMELNDLEHFIEFFNFSASDGYKLAKLIQNVRRRRRDIKNEMRRINILIGVDATSLASGKTVANLASVDNQQYTPRVLLKMFESGKLE